jgi:hypothetical protein
MATSSLTWYHGGQTRIQRDIPGHSGWVFFGGVIHCISIFRSGKNGARRTSSRSSVSHPPVSVLNPIAFPRGHGWTWTPGYIPMLRYYKSSADINMELAIAVCTTDPIGSMYAIMVTFTINISQMLAYIPYMDPMGMWIKHNRLPTIAKFYQPTDPGTFRRRPVVCGAYFSVRRDSPRTCLIGETCW